VALNSSIVELLKRERIPYTCFRHAPAYTAQEEAAVSHILGRCWAKVVICIADDQPVQAVLPAHHTVDLEQLRVLANVGALRLAREDEIATLYPDYEVGAMPPFGAVFGHRVFVDQCLVGEPELVFNAGTHTEALCMHYGDVAELAKPIVGLFAQTSGRRGPKAPNPQSVQPRTES
jgi:Ala-tRNA(Pro) deacylase